MGKYRLDSISQLARQMRFTPIPRRLEQLDAAEVLLLRIRPEKTYQFHEISCAITGFDPKESDASHLAGEALQHDIGLLLEEVSESLQLHLNASSEPILTIEDVAQRLSVTSKTVQRWRRRGLPARRYTFTDGKRRIGFRSSSVMQFVGSPSGAREVLPPSSDKDFGWLIQRAERLSSMGFWPLLIGQRLTSRAGLSPLAIVQILLQYERGLTFAQTPSATLRASVCEMRDRGLTLRQIAEQTGLPVFGIYRIELERRLMRALRKPVRFYDDPLYHDPNAAEAINQIIAQEPLAEASGRPARVPADLPPYLRDLYRIPLLTASRERGLFLQMHYLRLLAQQQQMALDPQVSSYRQLRRFNHLRQSARLVRAKIVEANLRLVVSVAKKHLRPNIGLMELVSEGNMTLIRAADGFDIHRGHRFSTYAVYALMRCFARYIPATIESQRRAADPERLATVRDPLGSRRDEQTLARDHVMELLRRLEPRERDVLAARFGLHDIELSCQEVGGRMRLSSQRIGQIERAAIAKLREHSL